MTIWDFANNHWLVTLFLAAIAAGVIKAPFQYAFRTYNRHLRHKNIALHGWPRAPLDADGDLVYPEKKP